MIYKAFMSYSHAADGKLAPALQSALHRFAKPWYRLRAIRIFRDKTSLSVNPALWPAIEKALGESEYFILLASTEAAASRWVEQEVDYWRKNVSAKKILIVLTDGQLAWHSATGDFDWNRTTAIPPNLRRAFSEEPLYLDLRWAKTEEHLSLSNPRFRESIAELAASLHDRPKDEIAGEDIRQYRKTKRVAWSAVIALLFLTLSSAIAAYLAIQQKNLAEEQRQIALARQLAAQTITSIERKQDAQLSLLLALEAVRTTLDPGVSAVPEAESALRRALASAPLAIMRHDDAVNAVTFSPDGARLATVSEDHMVYLWDGATASRVGFLGHHDGINQVVFSPTESRLITVSEDNTVRLWDAGRGAEVLTLPQEDEVTAVVFSPDQSRLATISNDTVHVWEGATGSKLAVFAHEDEVKQVAFSPNGTRLITTSKDNTVHIWDASAGLDLAILRHEGDVDTVVFSPDGARLATVDSKDNTVYLHDGTTGAKVAALRHEDKVTEVVFSPDGTRLVTITAGDGATLLDVSGAVHLWEASTGAELGALPHAGPVWTAVFSPDGTRLATSSTFAKSAVDHPFEWSLPNATASQLWDAEAGNKIAVLNHEDGVDHLMFSPDGKWVATATQGNIVHLWNGVTGAKVSVLRYEEEATRFVNLDAARGATGYKRLGIVTGTVPFAFSPDGLRMATASKDNTVRLWDTTTGTELTVLRHSGPVWAVGFSPDGARLVTASYDNTVRLWGVKKTPNELVVVEHNAKINDLIFSPDGTRLVTANDDNTARVWHATSGAELARLHHENTVKSVVFSPDGTKLVTGSAGTARVWHAATGEELARLSHQEPGTWGHGREAVYLYDVIDLAFSRHSSRLAALADWSGDTWLWDTGRWSLIARLSHREGTREWVRQINDIDFSPDGSRLATAGGHTARVWHATSGAELARLHHENTVKSVVFSPDGSLLATADSRTVHLWNVTKAAELAQLPHENMVNVVVFSPDASLLATADGRTVHLWNVTKAAELAALRHEAPVNAVAFSPDGTRLATASDDRTARLWDSATGAESVVLHHDAKVREALFSPDGAHLVTISGDNTMHVWRVTVEELASVACQILTRNLTYTEWRQYLRDQPYRETCPNLP